MRFFKRACIAIPITLLVSFGIMMLMIYTDITNRKAELTTYVRLAMRDALINIQTTEENGLDASGYTGALHNRNDYAVYLAELKNNAGAGSATAKETLEALQTFLESNQIEAGDAIFRPIQFGMTYVDPTAFKASFKHSLQSLVDANYKITDTNGNSQNKKIVCNDALHVYLDDMNSVVNIDGPHLVEFNTGSEVLRALYGVADAADYIEEINSKTEASSGLGISTAATPTFYVYYDITVSVPWGSSTTLPLLSRTFLSSRWPGSETFEYNERVGSSTDELQYLRIHSDDMRIEYTYRYVLLN